MVAGQPRDRERQIWERTQEIRGVQVERLVQLQGFLPGVSLPDVRIYQVLEKQNEFRLQPDVTPG